MITLSTLLLSLALALLAGVAVHENLQRRRLATQLAQLQQKLEIFQQSLHALTASAAGADKRMFRLEAMEKRLCERQETIENQRLSEQPYAQAIRMVQQGAGTSRLVEELQLSESEADLIFRLHGLKHDA